jgi:hypothetical protein
MTTTTLRMEPTNTRKLTAIIVWFGAVYTTMLFLGALGLSVGVWSVLFAMIVQGALTSMESRIWQGKPDVLTGIVLAFDTIINAAGVWQYVKRIPSTNVYAMLKDLGAPAEVSVYALGAFALAVGVILAAAPEIVWGSDNV